MARGTFRHLSTTELSWNDSEWADEWLHCVGMLERLILHYKTVCDQRDRARRIADLLHDRVEPEGHHLPWDRSDEEHTVESRLQLLGLGDAAADGGQAPRPAPRSTRHQVGDAKRGTRGTVDCYTLRQPASDTEAPRDR